MTFAPGTKLGPYEILAPIGAGGMGEVYRARDPRVGRDVAIKVSSEQFTDRFTREIHAVAALNHSNVCTLHDVGSNYLVMELVEGPTLADRIKQGPIPLEESLEIAKQIADALEAAHEKGIVHRDLKPGNIKIRLDGTVKVLDFGLAKVEENAAVSLETSPTLSVAQTAAGVLLGTAAYMSPEQARGKTVDKRADIWAFGVVLYEMLTGRRLFSGDTVSDTLASVLKEAPEFEKIPTKVKPLLHSCLERNPANRLRDIGDAWKLLESAPEAIPGSSGPVKKPWLAWTIAALSVLIALALGFALFRKPVPGPPEVMRFEIPFPDKVLPAELVPFAVSPDGRQLVFAATSEDGSTRLWLRPIESLEARPLPGTESGYSPFWSPDSRFIAFFSGGKLKRTDLSGSPPQTICDISSPGFLSGGSWNRNDVIIFGGRNGIFRVSAVAGSPSLLTKPTPGLETAHVNPKFLPDGQNFLYACVSSIPDKAGIYLGSLESKPERPSKRLLATPLTGLHVTSESSGQCRLLFTREQVLMSQPFDIKRIEMAGEPQPLIEPVGSFAASSNGVLIWRPADASYTQPVWVDREGRKLAEVGEPGEYPTFDLSKDSSRLVVSKRLQGRQNLWVIDMLRGVPTRLTLADVQHVDPRWSPDGREVIFGSTADPGRSPFRISLSDLKCEQVFKFEGGQFALDDWSPDGSHILFHSTRAFMAGTMPELWTLPLSGDKKPALVTRSLTGYIDQAQFSPDSNWIAYNTNESGRYEVNVVRFPSGSDKLQVSTAGGVQPTWKGDGRELYFIAPDGNLMAVDVQLGASIKPGQPRSLFKTPLTTISFQTEQYLPSSDGKRFLFMMPHGGGSPSPFTVILNWTSLLKK